MTFFMDYYKMTMAPSMVVIDTAHNPFKNHILQLASGSQSLQHAICALAACNLRMKRRLSLGQDTRELYEKLIAEKKIADYASCFAEELEAGEEQERVANEARARKKAGEKMDLMEIMDGLTKL